jgi:hypothetical protein
MKQFPPSPSLPSKIGGEIHYSQLKVNHRCATGINDTTAAPLAKFTAGVVDTPVSLKPVVHLDL